MDLAYFFGRMHPLLVHFPIALVISAAMVQWWHLLRGKDNISNPAQLMHLLGAVGACITAASGWLSAGEPTGRAGELLSQHRYLGVAAAVISSAALLFILRSPTRASASGTIAYTLALTFAACTVGICAHAGGKITRGEHYITFSLSRSTEQQTGTNPGNNNGLSKPNKARAQPRLAPPGTILTVTFDSHIVPIFAKHCYECHGPKDAYGKLRLDDLSRMYDRDKRHWAIVPGEPDKSSLYYRIRLAPDTDDRMPPTGEMLDPQQVALIHTWIKEGAWEGVQKPE